LNNIGSTSNPWIDSDGIHRAIGRTGSTFHTPVFVHNPCFVSSYFKDTVRADEFTSSTTGAGLRIEIEGAHMRKVSEFFHKLS